MGNQDIKRLQTSRGPVEYLDEGSGEVVLSLHGAMGGYDQAQILMRAIGPPGCRLLGLSRPGYLGTPLAAGRTPEEQADLYAEFLELLEIRQAVVIAISGGGPGALHFALRHPERCRGLVLISTCGGKADNRIPLFFKFMTFLAQRSPTFVTMMQQKTDKNLKLALSRSVSDPVILERTVNNLEVMALYREVAVGGFDRMAERIAGTRNDIEVTQTRTYPLTDITVPTLVVHGTRDPLVPFREHGRRLASEIPGAQLLAVEGGEHVVIFTHRDEVRRKVGGFLETLNPGAPQ